MKRDDKGGAARGSSLQKITAIQNGGSSHDAPRILLARKNYGLGGFGFACRRGRGAMDGFANALVGTAAADVAAHEIVDIGIGGIGFFVERRHGGHDLSRLAITAL